MSSRTGYRETMSGWRGGGRGDDKKVYLNWGKGWEGEAVDMAWKRRDQEEIVRSSGTHTCTAASAKTPFWNSVVLWLL